MIREMRKEEKKVFKIHAGFPPMEEIQKKEGHISDGLHIGMGGEKERKKKS